MPTVAHFLYIPGMLLIGVAIGFVLGAKAARSEVERTHKRRRR